MLSEGSLHDSDIVNWELNLDQSNPKNYLDSEREYFERIGGYFSRSSGTFTEKSHAFARFVNRQALSYFLARNEIFSKILNVHGSILDFGCYRGSSLFTWLQLSSIYEPYNHMRKVIGFDSFQGFSELGEKDSGAEDDCLEIKTLGGMAYSGSLELLEGIELINMNRPLGHVEKGRIVEGVLPGALGDYLDSHQESIIAMANFGLGLYEPTLKILELIKPRLVRGSILVFEDLNQATWPGETRALFDVFEERFSLNRVPYCPHVSYVQL